MASPAALSYSFASSKSGCAESDYRKCVAAFNAEVKASLVEGRAFGPAVANNFRRFLHLASRLPHKVGAQTVKHAEDYLKKSIEKEAGRHDAGPSPATPASSPRRSGDDISAAPPAELGDLQSQLDDVRRQVALIRELQARIEDLEAAVKGLSKDEARSHRLAPYKVRNARRRWPSN